MRCQRAHGAAATARDQHALAALSLQGSVRIQRCRWCPAALWAMGPWTARRRWQLHPGGQFRQCAIAKRPERQMSRQHRYLRLVAQFGRDVGALFSRCFLHRQVVQGALAHTGAMAAGDRHDQRCDQQQQDRQRSGQQLPDAASTDGTDHVRLGSISGRRARAEHANGWSREFEGCILIDNGYHYHH